LAARGVTTHVLPATSTVDDVFAVGPDAVFLSPGPGDPATADHAVGLARGCAGPGCPAVRDLLRFADPGPGAGLRDVQAGLRHRGINQPVLDRGTGKVEVTAHNHGFAVRAPLESTVDTEYGASR